MQLFKFRKKDTKVSGPDVSERPEQVVIDPSREESAFHLDAHDEFAEEQDRISEEHRRIMAKVKIPEVQYGKVQDILDFLGIPFTFVLPESVLSSKSVKAHSFSLQAPYGYDQGEVDHFKKVVAKSLDHLMKNLDVRNEHVAELASVVDKLQVENHNLKLESEIADGVSIMTTTDQELESKLAESRLEVTQLTRRVKELESMHMSSSLEGEPNELVSKVQELEDELSLSSQAVEQKDELIRDLTIRLGSMEELIETLQSQQNLSDVTDDTMEDVTEEVTVVEHEPVDRSVTDVTEDFDLPVVDKIEPTPSSTPVSSNVPGASVYDFDDRDLDELITDWTEKK